MFRLNASIPRWVIIVMDLLLSTLALLFAYLIRFDLKADKALIEQQWAILSKSILIYYIVKFTVFYSFKIHKGLVRYTSTEDIKRIFMAVGLSSFIFFVLGIGRYYFVDDFFLFPTSVLIMEFLACFFFMIGSR
jgi:FlaA1/EpsC-like NDP-sugar epimerase